MPVIQCDDGIPMVCNTTPEQDKSICKMAKEYGLLEYYDGEGMFVIPLSVSFDKIQEFLKHGICYDYDGEEDNEKVWSLQMLMDVDEYGKEIGYKYCLVQRELEWI